MTNKYPGAKVRFHSKTPAKQPPPGRNALTPQMKGKLIKGGLRQLFGK